MARELKDRVMIDGTWWGPGPVPAAIAERITNPAAWTEDEQPTASDVGSMKKAELVAYADELGIHIPHNATKAEIVDILTDTAAGDEEE